MAQIGFDPSAAAFGSLVFILIAALWIVFLITALVFFGIGLFNPRSRKGIWFAICGGGVSFGLLFIAYLVLVPPQRSVVLDFRTGRTPPSGNWIGPPSEQLLAYQGRVDLTLSLPNGKTFDDRADLVVVDRSGALVTRVSIQRNLPREEAFALASRYMEDWNCEGGQNFDVWCNRQRAGNSGYSATDSVYAAVNDALIPSLLIELRYVTDDTWCVQLSAHWP